MRAGQTVCRELEDILVRFFGLGENVTEKLFDNSSRLIIVYVVPVYTM